MVHLDVLPVKATRRRGRPAGTDSAQTRARALDRFATDKPLLLSYHFPWPGVGRVAKEGEGYAWMPAPMDVTSLG